MLLLSLFIVLLLGLIYCFAKFSTPKYQFKAKYYMVKLEEYTSEILKFEGKKTKKESQNHAIVLITGNPGIV